jgi:hypothetical protein
MLSPDIEQRLLRASQNEKEYRPKEEVTSVLREKSMVMFVGPAATGKTYIMNKLAELDPRFQRVPVFTTREARPDDDPGMFRFVPHEDNYIAAILDNIDARDIVQYAIHPTSGRIYGSEMHDYPGEYNMLAMLSGAVKQMEQLPFRQTYIIGLVTPGELWKSRFIKRYPVASEEKEKRRKEAIGSLEWLLDNNSRVIWASNQEAGAAQIADGIIRAILYNEREDSCQIAEDMLKVAREMK